MQKINTELSEEEKNLTREYGKKDIIKICYKIAIAKIFFVRSFINF